MFWIIASYYLNYIPLINAVRIYKMTFNQLHTAASIGYLCNLIKHYPLLQQDLVLVPATRQLLPSDQEYMMRYIPVHKLNANDSHKLVVRNVSPLMKNTSNPSSSCWILVTHLILLIVSLMQVPGHASL